MEVEIARERIKRINLIEQPEWVEVILKLLKEKSYFLKSEKRMQNDAV
jgi:hypothetical protein